MENSTVKDAAMTCKLVEATPAQAIKRCKDAKWPMDLQAKWVRERLRERLRECGNDASCR